MQRVIIESPYAGDTARNLSYARTCLRDCLERGESPLASHLLYTQVLDDDVARERALGMAAGWVWFGAAQALVVCVDLGVTEGMRRGIQRARNQDLPVIYRRVLLGRDMAP